MTDDLDRLGEKLARFRQQEKAEKQETSEKQENGEDMRKGIAAGTELVTCIGAGGLIGWGLDRWLGTSPIFLIVFLLAGIAAGFLNAYRITQNLGTSVGFASLHNRKKQGKNAPDEK